MDKILVQDLPAELLKGVWRPMCEVQCPDCKAIRKIRKDAFTIAATSLCRSCCNRRRPTKPQEELFDINQYVRTKKGRIYQLYQAQKSKSIERGYAAPSYTQEELYNWAMNQEVYHTLFDAWEAAGYSKKLGPSVDRINDYVSYTLQNIRLVTWDENNDKGRHYQKIGENLKNSIAVDQFTLDGKWVARHFSQQEAARKTGADAGRIAAMCQGRLRKKGNKPDGSPRYVHINHVGGYVWKYASVPNDNREKFTP